MTSSNICVDEVAVAIMHLDEFMFSLPSCFHRDRFGRIIHDPEEANLFLDERDNFLNAQKKILVVDNKEEFLDLKRRLLSVPTYITVTLSEFDVDLEKRIGKWHNFMVCVNPKNPAIREELEENLNECEELMEKGKHFSFCFRLGPCLRRWYEIVNELPYFSSRSFNSSICITNFMEECYMCYSPLLWTTLFPFMLVICGPFILYKMIACKELNFMVRACITLVIGNSNSTDSTPSEHMCIVKCRTNSFTNRANPSALYDTALTEGQEPHERKVPLL